MEQEAHDCRPVAVSTARRMKSFFVLGVCDAVRTHLARLGLVDLRPGLEQAQIWPGLVTEHQVLARSQPEPCPQMCTWTSRLAAGDRRSGDLVPSRHPKTKDTSSACRLPRFHVAYRHLQLALRFRDEPIPGFRPVLEAHLTASRTTRRPSLPVPDGKDHLLASPEKRRSGLGKSSCVRRRRDRVPRRGPVASRSGSPVPGRSAADS